MAIDTKLETIKSGVLGVRNAIKAIDSSLANGTVDTLGDDIRTLNNRKYIWKWVNNNGTYELQKEVNNGTVIGTNKYKDRTDIVAVILPDNIIDTSDYGFSGCTNLEYINLSNLQKIRRGCFGGSKLCGVVNCPNLNFLENNAFHNTNISKVENLGTITGLGGATNGGVSTFSQCHNLTSVVLPTTVKTIPNYCFNHDENLATINLENITSIGSAAFRDCSSLNLELNLPNLTSMGASCFSGTGITKVLSLGSITSLGNFSTGTVACFAPCPNLTYVNLPATLTNIPGYCFVNDSKLETLICNATTPPKLYNTGVFSGCTLLKIYVPYSEDHSILNAYKTASNWSNYATKIFELNEDGSVPA